MSRYFEDDAVTSTLGDLQEEFEAFEERREELLERVESVLQTGEVTGESESELQQMREALATEDRGLSQLHEELVL